MTTLAESYRRPGATAQRIFLRRSYTTTDSTPARPRSAPRIPLPRLRATRESPSDRHTPPIPVADLPRATADAGADATADAGAVAFALGATADARADARAVAFALGASAFAGAAPSPALEFVAVVAVGVVAASDLKFVAEFGFGAGSGAVADADAGADVRIGAEVVAGAVADVAGVDAEVGAELVGGVAIAGGVGERRAVVSRVTDRVR
ncbi:hypothetical protein [Spirillospora sp. NPDC047279]|uniref:hypothetical protein n=1 Tax=Spirillospora sp. NPDC047279 TaxID=3155478 RepID=UPI0033F615A8